MYPSQYDVIPDLSIQGGRMLFQSERTIPGSVDIKIRRYEKVDNWTEEDTAVIVYHHNKGKDTEHQLELRYCLVGNVYCNKFQDECDQCKLHSSLNCDEKVQTIDFISITFSSNIFKQFLGSRIPVSSDSEKMLSFQYQGSFAKGFTVCNRTRTLLQGLLNHSYTDTLENIFVNAQSQMLLLCGIDCMEERVTDTISCKFLCNQDDREKIMKAREILLEQIGEPITIKQLSRRVAMNECYLKKGFKEMFGTTIFEFYQNQRMEHAKYLLYEKGLTVTEVSSMLGYSSISHFSTAFKKQTGLKPCELLLRAS
jgi:AraC-like DNA-binding protein